MSIVFSGLHGFLIFWQLAIKIGSSTKAGGSACLSGRQATAGRRDGRQGARLCGLAAPAGRGAALVQWAGPPGRQALHGVHEFGFAGGMDPAAVFGDVGEGADGMEHFGAAEVARVNRFDDVCEGGLQVAVAQGEKIESVGVVVAVGFSFDVEAVHDRLRTAPVEEGFFDLLAVRMFADGTFAGVALEGGGFGPFGAADGRFAT